MKKIIYVFCMSLLFISCEKCRTGDPLEGDKSLLIGKWEWDYSILKFNSNVNPGVYYYDTIYNEDVDYNHSIVFQECGQINSLKNDSIVNSYFIKVDDFNLKTCENCFDFIIFLDGNSENRFYGYGDINSIVTNKSLHPVFKDQNDIAFSYNYYKKL